MSTRTMVKELISSVVAAAGSVVVQLTVVVVVEGLEFTVGLLDGKTDVGHGQGVFL